MYKHATIALFAILAAFATGCQRSNTNATAPTISSVQQSAGATLLDDSTFETEIGNSHGVAIVDFYARWCGPCRKMLPIIDAMSADVSAAKIAKLDVDAAKVTSSKFGIQAIPCLIVFKDGKEVERHLGVHTREDISGWIEACAGKTVGAANATP